jgi:tryptophan 2,3-dioxygenase
MVYYHDYLQLDKILQAQELESEKAGSKAHEEMLFIITHQTFELWFKQVLVELTSVIEVLSQDYVAEAQVSVCLSRIQRTNRIMEHLANQFSLMETMTPGEFMEFRAFLNPASGFQSIQWRVLERTLGLPEKKRVLPHYTTALTKEHAEHVQQSPATPTLLAAVEGWLSNMPFVEHGQYTFWQAYTAAVMSMLDADVREVQQIGENEHHSVNDALEQIERNRQNFMGLLDANQYSEMLGKGFRVMSQRATLAALFINTYRHEPLLQMPYRLLDAIVELDRLVALWRYRHAMMVSRMIGMRVGTGGSSGHDYLLRTAMQQRVFDDLTSLSSYLVPSAVAPPLPTEIRQRLQFVHEHPPSRQ